jgi:hypothetical protein
MAMVAVVYHTIIILAFEPAIRFIGRCDGETISEWYLTWTDYKEIVIYAHDHLVIIVWLYVLR